MCVSVPRGGLGLELYFHSLLRKEGYFGGVAGDGVLAGPSKRTVAGRGFWGKGGNYNRGEVATMRCEV
jgi:hypothetical protein